jgi:hypothetical protein
MKFPKFKSCFFFWKKKSIFRVDKCSQELANNCHERSSQFLNVCHYPKCVKSKFQTPKPIFPQNLSQRTLPFCDFRPNLLSNLSIFQGFKLLSSNLTSMPIFNRLFQRFFKFRDFNKFMIYLVSML